MMVGQEIGVKRYTPIGRSFLRYRPKHRPEKPMGQPG